MVHYVVLNDLISLGIMVAFQYHKIHIALMRADNPNHTHTHTHIWNHVVQKVLSLRPKSNVSRIFSVVVTYWHFIKDRKIGFNFFSFIRRGSVLPYQKCSTILFFLGESWKILNAPRVYIYIYIYIYISEKKKIFGVLWELWAKEAKFDCIII